jgi:preprotein translocase subunit SecG
MVGINEGINNILKVFHFFLKGLFFIFEVIFNLVESSTSSFKVTSCHGGFSGFKIASFFY